MYLILVGIVMFLIPIVFGDNLKTEDVSSFSELASYNKDMFFTFIGLIFMGIGILVDKK
jgi:SNF family Na+-dependent transporter